MPLTKRQKQERVQWLEQELAGAKAVLVTSFERLTVAQDFELRKQVRAAGGKYRVIKNTLAQRAAAAGPAAAVLSRLKGVNSIAYTGGDAVALAKALRKYAKDNPALSFKAGFVDGQAITAREIEALAALPSREQLLAKLLYLMQAPASRLAATIAAAGRNTAVVLDQAVKQEKFAR